ncbi:hypothetical protein L596_012015 [Steinernema carpocapsae]|uniref:Uncharacterized protein n=1 Tax=Steinernema carpocapsae TaxID=34508 RepID=A0A4U5NVQ4_STECR|nr:hypothetical protein L596_012015 [Steinernema carpocapsae]
MEIARLTGLKCLSPTRSTAPNKTEWPSEDQVKEFEAEISRLTNLVEQKTKELEDLAFTLEEERANAQCLEERVKELEAQCTEQQKSINDDIPEIRHNSLPRFAVPLPLSSYSGAF